MSMLNQMVNSRVNHLVKLVQRALSSQSSWIFHPCNWSFPAYQPFWHGERNTHTQHSIL